MTGPSPTAALLARWQRLGGSRPGRWLFSRLVGRAARYSGSIRPLVLELAPGRCRVQMRDRPAVRNHLRSIHAVALMNLGEMATGLATLAALPVEARAILVGLAMEYRKKARGTLVADCSCRVAPAADEREETVRAEIRDRDGDVVAVATATWRIGPRPEDRR